MSLLIALGGSLSLVARRIEKGSLKRSKVL
jgi:hypothetical protein